MVKHKRKKSAPTPGPDDSKKKEKPEEHNENPKGTSDQPKDTASTTDQTPPTEPVSTQEKSEKDRKLDRLFWIRVILALMGGAVATFLFEPLEGEERRWTSIGFMIVIFIGSAIMAKGMKIPLPSSDRKKIVTQGMGSYVFLYLFMWIVTYTIVHLPSSDVTSVPLP
ncbi:MAG: hypothetical protein GWN01_13675 [Nitrosopumilaceae archaeon]|nr:hypothetical protein [Nitrosopumilaceae archaeon]NIU01914.1 hypothetical protein [Nitrosopumilaceae archaeon]NIU88318.1 hypothetical protein [Nitrosopumilaceae archaeon]NIV66610.1 hypothetical protein [Nitrosopumilaceae archaeon]NIX62515.1 hypothetical protein [Nitrosopumilaceae archaeon]